MKTKPPKTIVKPSRLTNDMRETFIEAVMVDVPAIDFKERIRDAVNKAHQAALPLAVKKMLADPALCDYVKVCSITLNWHDDLPHGEYISFRLPALSEEALETEIKKIVEPFLKEWNDQMQAHKDLRDKLRTVAYSCTTTTALAEAFPEFAQYLPQTPAEGTRNLPALANVVSDFVKAGWPKGKKAVTA